MVKRLSSQYYNVRIVYNYIHRIPPAPFQTLPFRLNHPRNLLITPKSAQVGLDVRKAADGGPGAVYAAARRCYRPAPGSGAWRQRRVLQAWCRA